MSIADRAAELLGSSLAAVTPLAGGDLSSVLRIELTDGRTAVVKGGPDPAAEAAMLEALSAADVPAPAVLAFDDAVLVLEAVDGSGSAESAWRDLGRVLARLHAHRGSRYGWPVDYAFGSVIIDNAWSDDWPQFWGERRLASQARHLPAKLARRVEALAGDLAGRLPGKPAPSLLHGDLWTGNVLASGASITGLIDPACYYGDAEVDFAMLRLFARPESGLLAAYGGLAPGSEERLPIYQLWPALVHFRLFGAMYRSMLERLLDSLGC